MTKKMDSKNQEKILEIQNVKKRFSDGTLALDDISFSINKGEFTVIAGSNGSGKSVLMSLIAELDKPTEGKIILHGLNAGLVFQNADAQILGETPEEDVEFGAKNSGLKGKLLSDCVEKVLSYTGLLHKKDSPARMMSGGEKRRLSVAGILAMSREFLIFDEPFANLDWPGVKTVTSILKQLKDERKTIIVLTHELEKILALSDRFIVLDKGKIRFDGKPEDGLKQPLDLWSIRNPLFSYTKLEDLIWL